MSARSALDCFVACALRNHGARLASGWNEPVFGWRIAFAHRFAIMHREAADRFAQSIAWRIRLRRAAPKGARLTRRFNRVAQAKRCPRSPGPPQSNGDDGLERSDANHIGAFVVLPLNDADAIILKRAFHCAHGVILPALRPAKRKQSCKLPVLRRARPSLSKMAKKRPVDVAIGRAKSRRSARGLAAELGEVLQHALTVKRLAHALMTGAAIGLRAVAERA